MFTTRNSIKQQNETQSKQDILAPDQAYEGLYGQAPNGTGNGRAYQQGNYRHDFVI